MKQAELKEGGVKLADVILHSVTPQEDLRPTPGLVNDKIIRIEAEVTS